MISLIIHYALRALNTFFYSIAPTYVQIIPTYEYMGGFVLLFAYIWQTWMFWVKCGFEVCKLIYNVYKITQGTAFFSFMNMLGFPILGIVFNAAGSVVLLVLNLASIKYLPDTTWRRYLMIAMNTLIAWTLFRYAPYAQILNLG